MKKIRATKKPFISERLDFAGTRCRIDIELIFDRFKNILASKTKPLTICSCKNSSKNEKNKNEHISAMSPFYLNY